MKSVQMRSYFWSEYRKIRTRNNSVFGHFSRCDKIYLDICRAAICHKVFGSQIRWNNEKVKKTSISFAILS